MLQSLPPPKPTDARVQTKGFASSPVPNFDFDLHSVYMCPRLFRFIWGSSSGFTIRLAITRSRSLEPTLDPTYTEREPEVIIAPIFIYTMLHLDLRWNDAARSTLHPADS